MSGRKDPVALRALRAAGAAGFVLVAVVPLAALVWSLVVSGAPGGLAPTLRRAGLLVTSFRFSALVASGEVVAGALAAAWLWVRPRRARVWIGVILLGLALPAIAHVAAYAGAAEGLSAWFGWGRPPAGAAAWFVQSMTLLPVATGVAYAGLLAVDSGSVDAARVQGGDLAALTRVALPLAAPALVASFGLTFALSVGEHAVPSSFAYDVYAMELYAEYSASGSAAGTLLLALPLLAVSLAVAVGCASQVRALVTRGVSRKAFVVPSQLGVASALPALAAALAIGWPVFVVVALLSQSGGPPGVVAALTSARAEVVTTVIVCVSAGALAGIVALACEATLRPRAPRVWVWAAALALLAVPGPVVGAGLVAAYGGAAFAPVYDSAAVVVAAALARYLPVAVLVVGAAAARAGEGATEAALIAASPLTAYRHAVVPRLSPAAAIGGLAVAALASGEIGAALMVVPAGVGTAATRMYNLLHYGASREVAGLALAVCAVGATVAAAGWAVAARGMRGRAAA